MYVNLFVLLFATMVLGVLVHAVLARVARNTSPYVLAILAINGVFACACFGLSTAGLHFSLGGLGLAIVFSLSFTFAYLLFLIGIVNQSPTLSLVRWVKAAADTGSPVGEGDFSAFIGQSEFVGVRVSGLRRAADLSVEGDKVLLSARARHIARLVDTYRWLVGSARETSG